MHITYVFLNLALRGLERSADPLGKRGPLLFLAGIVTFFIEVGCATHLSARISLGTNYTFILVNISHTHIHTHTHTHTNASFSTQTAPGCQNASGAYRALH